GVSAWMAWNTPNSVRLPKHITQPINTSMCVRNDGSVNAGSRHCRTGSREGMLVNMDGDLLVLCARLVTLENHAKSTRNPALFHHQIPAENLRKFRERRSLKRQRRRAYSRYLRSRFPLKAA